MISVRLPPELIERIDEHAKQRGETRSESMRALLEAGFRVQGRGGAASKRSKATRKEAS